MNKQNLIDMVANEVGMSRSAAEETIQAFIATVIGAAVKGDVVDIPRPEGRGCLPWSG